MDFNPMDYGHLNLCQRSYTKGQQRCTVSYCALTGSKDEGKHNGVKEKEGRKLNHELSVLFILVEERMTYPAPLSK